MEHWRQVINSSVRRRTKSPEGTRWQMDWRMTSVEVETNKGQSSSQSGFCMFFLVSDMKTNHGINTHTCPSLLAQLKHSFLLHCQLLSTTAAPLTQTPSGAGCVLAFTYSNKCKPGPVRLVLSVRFKDSRTNLQCGLFLFVFFFLSTIWHQVVACLRLRSKKDNALFRKGLKNYHYS